MKEYQSGADFGQQPLEWRPLPIRKSPENQEDVPVPVEGPRFDVQESNQVLELDEVLLLKVDLRWSETFAQKSIPFELVLDSSLPVALWLQVGFD